MLAIVAAQFPLRSETFVVREVRALRERGWDLRTVSLLESPDLYREEFEDLTEGHLVLYGPNLGRHLLLAAAETAQRPLRSVGTLLMAVRDAVAPGEPLAPGNRLKLIAQSVAGLALASKLRAAGVRHIHCHFAHSPTSVAMYAARQLGIRFSFTGHANDLFERRALLGRKVGRAAFVSSISVWHRSLYASLDPSASAKVPVIRCGVDAREWSPTDRPIAADGRLRVLTVCRLFEKKGVDVLIRGLADLRQRHGRSFELTVAGDGHLKDELQALSRHLGCDDSIRWLGEVGNARVRSLMTAADLFALPCRVDRRGDRDGIPVALMEAMSCGLPVIAGDLPAIRELVEDGVTGLIHDGNDPRALADQLALLGARSDERRRLGAAGRERVMREFSLERNVRRLEDALREFAALSADALPPQE